jgi:hypothetical protein
MKGDRNTGTIVATQNTDTRKNKVHGNMSTPRESLAVSEQRW